MSEEIKVYSSKSDLEELLESIVWMDIVNELDAWLKGFEIERDAIVDDAAETNPSTAAVLMHLGDLNGRKKTIEYMKQIPSILLQVLEDNKDDSRRNKTN